MSINTGKTPISTATLLAILSLSLVVNLPGLAVTPMLSTLAKIFPGSTETEKQLLTIMPNLLIIPFVLLSGKLSMTKHKIATIIWALIIFVASSVAYMFAKSMAALIIISCALGCGAGLVIPFAAGLIADCFVGDYRVKMMGIKSGISNLSLVVATFAVGWLSSGNWHMPFIVYLISIIPLLLAYQLKKIPNVDITNVQKPLPKEDPKISDYPRGVPVKPGKISHGFYIGKISQLIGVYFFLTFATMSISYYCPFMIQENHMPDSLTGTVTAIFFLFIFLPGFLLTKVISVTKEATFILTGFMVTVGLGIFAFVDTPWLLCVGAALAGAGYGVCQPLIYDKASRTVLNPHKATMALAIVLTANYVSIALTPVIVDFFRDIFHTHSDIFPFYLTTAMTAIYGIITIVFRKSFAFSINDTYY